MAWGHFLGKFPAAFKAFRDCRWSGFAGFCRRLVLGCGRAPSLFHLGADRGVCLVWRVVWSCWWRFHLGGLKVYICRFGSQISCLNLPLLNSTSSQTQSRTWSLYYSSSSHWCFDDSVFTWARICASCFATPETFPHFTLWTKIVTYDMLGAGSWTQWICWSTVPEEFCLLCLAGLGWEAPCFQEAL